MFDSVQLNREHPKQAAIRNTEDLVIAYWKVKEGRHMDHLRYLGAQQLHYGMAKLVFTWEPPEGVGYAEYGMVSFKIKLTH